MRIHPSKDITNHRPDYRVECPKKDNIEESRIDPKIGWRNKITLMKKKKKKNQCLGKDYIASEQIDDMTRKKCRILDCVLDTFPEHLKTKAKSMCDILKCKDRLFILPSHEIVIDGKIDRGSNIRDYIMDSLVEPPKPGTIKFTMLEKENERLKQNLAYVEKALARARGVWRCRKFESIIDGTVDRCDFSDDTYSDESSDGEDDPDKNEEDDEGEYDEEDEEGDTDEEEDEEPSRKRKKKN